MATWRARARTQSATVSQRGGTPCRKPTPSSGAGKMGGALCSIRVPWDPGNSRLCVEGRSPSAAFISLRGANVEFFYGPDRHDAYVAWRDSHPLGFVLQSNNHPTNTDLVLHRTTCPTMRGTPAYGEVWTNYPKWCSNSRSELSAYAQNELGTPVRRCASC
jgi:hypothetical protein